TASAQMFRTNRFAGTDSIEKCSSCYWQIKLAARLAGSVLDHVVDHAERIFEVERAPAIFDDLAAVFLEMLSGGGGADHRKRRNGRMHSGAFVDIKQEPARVVLEL